MSQPKYTYTILLKESLDPRWAEWFEGSRLEGTDCGTVIQGEVPDRAALHGLIERIRDLNLSLVSIKVKDL